MHCDSAELLSAVVVVVVFIVVVVVVVSTSIGSSGGGGEGTMSSGLDGSNTSASTPSTAILSDIFRKKY